LRETTETDDSFLSCFGFQRTETDGSFILMCKGEAALGRASINEEALGCQGFINGSPSQECLTLHSIKQEAYDKDIFMNLCRIYDKN
jgi:hypothetical protein